MYLVELFAIKKNQNGNLKPDDFNRINNVAQRQWLSFLCGNLEGYVQGHPLPRAEFGNNRTARQRLTPSIYNYILNINAGTGISPYPGDYIQTDSMNSIYGHKNIRFVPQHKLSGIYNSTIDPVASNPIYLINDFGFEFIPSTQWQARLSYVRNPPDIKWASTPDANGRLIYYAVNSVDPIWDEISCFEIIVRALALVGVNLQLNIVMAYAQEIKKDGQ